MKKLAFLIGLLIVVTITGNAQQITKINASELASKIQDLDNTSYTIIDGRNQEMFDEFHLPNAINVDAFSEGSTELLSQQLNNSTIILYCTQTNRSEILAKKLSELNFTGSVLIISDGVQGIKNIYSNSTSTKETNKNESKDKPKGEVIVQVFGNFDFNLSPESNQLFRFWIGRSHFGYQYSFNEQWQAKIIIDAGRPTTMDEFAIFDTSYNLLYGFVNLNEGSYYTMTLKFASLEWKPVENLTIQAGSVLLNHYITQEKFWGYRYLAPTFQDKYYGLPSGDLGVIAYYKMSNKFGLDLSVTNGEGFRKDQDMPGNIKIASGLDFYPIKSLQTRVYYEYYKLSYSNHVIEQQMISAFIGYKFKDKFRIGAEYNNRINQQFIQNLDLSGFSVFGTYSISKNFEFFARYDYLINNNSINSIQYPNLFAVITGVQYSPLEGIHVGLNYQGINSGTDFETVNQHLLLSFEYKF
ncbi:MAG: rhodanese-like domain-containing protein [Bacteroidales bacterium]|nr:rhodanese-like domain-containing protein [Bacteroidales bacterium]